MNLIPSTVDKFHFLIQSIRSHSLLLVNIVSWILLSKNVCFTVLTIFLHLVYFILFLDIWYVTRSLLQSLFHHALECLVIWTCLECLYHNSFAMEVNSWVTSSSFLWLRILVILIQLVLFLNLLMNFFSSLLFSTIVSFFFWINSFLITIWTDDGAWSKCP